MHQIVTSLLDLIGLLFVVAAAAVLVAQWSLPASLATAGVGVLAVSFLIDRRQGAKP